MSERIFYRIKPAEWPLPHGTHTILEAELTGPGSVTIMWNTDERQAQEKHAVMLTLTDDELAEIAVAAKAARARQAQ